MAEIYRFPVICPNDLSLEGIKPALRTLSSSHLQSAENQQFTPPPTRFTRFHFHLQKRLYEVYSNCKIKFFNRKKQTFSQLFSHNFRFSKLHESHKNSAQNRLIFYHSIPSNLNAPKRTPHTRKIRPKIGQKPYQIRPIFDDFYHPIRPIFGKFRQTPNSTSNHFVQKTGDFIHRPQIFLNLTEMFLNFVTSKPQG